MIQDYAADNPLVIGTALHTGIEKDAETAIKEYYLSFPIITDAHITEAMKLEMQIQKARAVVPSGKHEVLISTKHFKGFIDLLAPVGYMNRHHPENPYGTDVEVFDLYDFKYSNNVEHYKQSRQLHLYKYYFEQMNPGKKIRNLYFLFVPKNGRKQNPGESLYSYRLRVLDELAPTQPQLLQIPFDYQKVIEHLELIQDVQAETKYGANPGYLCRFCDYYDYCQKGCSYMILPSAERRNISETKKRKIWIYGAAFSGKTTMLDAAPNPLNLNTDGNIQFVTMPFIPIKDEVKVEGRVTKRKYAWEIFKETIGELEKGGNDFKTIIVDLLEDTREACRIFMYDQLKIQHESDSGYGKGWDIIKTEYLSTIRRLFNLDYENIIVVSHEDVSKDITKKNGQNITRIAPNIQDAIANKVAGMVDIVARVVVEDDGSRTLNFKQNEVIFGGGRLKGIKETSIPLSWEALMNVYDEANASVAAGNAAAPAPVEAPKSRSRKKDNPDINRVTGATPEEQKAEEALAAETTPAETAAPVEEPYTGEDEEIPFGPNAVEAPPKPLEEAPVEAAPEASAPESVPGRRTRRSRKAE